MKKWYWTLAIIAVFAAVLLFMDQKQTQTTSNKIQVVATIYPLWEFTKTIAGDDAQVELLLPPGSEPHHWEPTARDFAKLSQARVVICQGTNFEPWVKKSAGRNTLIYEAVPEGSDPHFWLDPLLAKEQVEKIASNLAKADPANASLYKDRAAELAWKLEQLHEEYSQSLAQAKMRTFITTHQAFDFLGNRYGLNPIALKGLAAEGEPRPGDLMRITQLAKKEGIRVIFQEPLENPRLAEVIAHEISGETGVLHPIGALTREDSKNGEDYFSLMRKNLKELKAALAGEDK